nr:hypothetical protein 21 [bacterium]
MKKEQKIILGVIMAVFSAVALVGISGLLGINLYPTRVGVVTATSLTADKLRFAVTHSDWGTIGSHINYWQGGAVYLEVGQADLCEPNRATCNYWGAHNPYQDSAEYRCRCHVSLIPVDRDVVNDQLRVTYLGYNIEPSQVDVFEGHITLYFPPLVDMLPKSVFDQSAVATVSGYIEMGQACSTTSDCGSGWIGGSYCGD